MSKSIYLDHHATTPVALEVFEAMRPYFMEHFGNAMSTQHSYGWTAKAAVEKAREQVADILQAQPREIFFTSGATESIHMALLGFLELQTEPKHILTSAVEHKCVLEVCARAMALGHEVTVLPVNRYGQVEIATLQAHLKPHTALVSLMHANNEIGSINAIAEIGALCRARDIIFHVDAAQTVGRLPIDVTQMNIDLLSLSGHKLYAPKGVGALFVRQSQPRVRLAPFLRGGGQEKSLRGGTHNVPGIVGLGTACELVQKEMATETTRLSHLRDSFIAAIQKHLPEVELNGHPSERLPHNINLSIEGVEPDQLYMGMQNVAFSSGSACSSSDTGGSHVLKAIGAWRENRILSTLRLGLGRSTTSEDLTYVAEKLIETVLKVRQNTEKSRNSSILHSSPRP